MAAVMETLLNLRVPSHVNYPSFDLVREPSTHLTEPLTGPLVSKMSPDCFCEIDFEQ